MNQTKILATRTKINRTFSIHVNDQIFARLNPTEITYLNIMFSYDPAKRPSAIEVSNYVENMKINKSEISKIIISVIFAESQDLKLDLIDSYWNKKSQTRYFFYKVFNIIIKIHIFYNRPSFRNVIQKIYYTDLSIH